MLRNPNTHLPSAALALFLSCAAPAWTMEPLADDFEAALLDTGKWATAQIQPNEYGFAASSRCGAQSVQIMLADQNPNLCGANCQRAELRIHPDHWPRYGDETWYSFSFRVEGDIPTVGSNRTVIGQWKAPTDDSPFLAQRFDNAVFHITIQDGKTRILVAKANGDPYRIRSFETVMSGLDRNSLRTVEALARIQALGELRRPSPTQIQPLTVPDSTVDTLAESLDLPDELRSIIPADEAVALIEEFSFLSDLPFYLGPSSLKVERNPDAVLPDPRKGWVDMTYRVRGGRLDNEHPPIQEGQIDIWANGVLVATVRGNISYTRAHDPGNIGQYFKIGIYRDFIPTKMSLYFDEFHQGSSREDVAFSCD